MSQRRIEGSILTANMKPSASVQKILSKGKLKRPAPCEMTVKMDSGRTLRFLFEPTETVLTVKKRIQEMTFDEVTLTKCFCLKGDTIKENGIPPERMRLCFVGREMQDGALLSEYHLGGNPVVYLTELKKSLKL